jgi:lipopolysaccharide/colanic/teichoic acid biosynthesis glycosyltransferase
MKRILDFIIALIGVIALLPLFIVIALLIKLTSRGSIFFKQIRVGQYGKSFSIYKFRTMVNSKKGLKLTIGKDPRVTKLGHVLRKTKLDELPQLINVLKGDMSLVGPRPEVPEYVNYYPSNIKEIVLSVKPGITDFASIEMIDENLILAKSSDPEQEYINNILPKKLEYGVKYVNKQNLALDIYLILLTLIKIIIRSR